MKERTTMTSDDDARKLEVAWHTAENDRCTALGERAIGNGCVLVTLTE